MISRLLQLVRPHLFVDTQKELTIEAETVLVKPCYLAICHADQRYYQGLRNPKILAQKLPLALIHEAWGEVIYDPQGVLPPGQRVFLIPGAEHPHSDLPSNYHLQNPFASSTKDGFSQEFIALNHHQLVPFSSEIDPQIATLGEFLSVCHQAIRRFQATAHSRKQRLVVIGDGSLGYTLSLLLKIFYPDSWLTVLGKSPSKLALFSFVDEVLVADNLPVDYPKFDHGFEVCGGNGSEEAINQLIDIVNPTATIVLMGVSEEKIAINTRLVLEKGLKLVGTSRSDHQDFRAVASLLAQYPHLSRYLKLIIQDAGVVTNSQELQKVFEKDHQHPFKTIFQLKI